MRKYYPEKCPFPSGDLDSRLMHGGSPQSPHPVEVTPFSGSMNMVICSAIEKHLLTYPDTAVNSAVFARVTVESSRHTNLGSPVTIGCIS